MVIHCSSDFHVVRATLVSSCNFHCRYCMLLLMSVLGCQITLLRHMVLDLWWWSVLLLRGNYIGISAWW